MYARIIAGKVAAVTGDMPVLGLGESALFAECGPEVREGWLLEGGALAAPPEPCPPGPNAQIDAAILALETGQHRALRELTVLSGTQTAAVAKARLEDIEARIAALRALRTPQDGNPGA